MEFERWSLDEVTDTTATLLRSRMMPALAAMLPASVTDSRGEQAATSLWSEEVDSVLEREKLEAFIKATVAATAGQEARDLREGDVFLVEATEALPLDGLRRPEQTDDFVGICKRLVKAIRDETAAQRQIAGVQYRQVLEQASNTSEPQRQ